MTVNLKMDYIMGKVKNIMKMVHLFMMVNLKIIYIKETAKNIILKIIF